jgi:Mrp family chromosome partitioning ATPase
LSGNLLPVCPPSEGDNFTVGERRYPRRRETSAPGGSNSLFIGTPGDAGGGGRPTKCNTRKLVRPRLESGTRRTVNVWLTLAARGVLFFSVSVPIVSVEEFLQATKLYLATSSNREFVSIAGSAALALVTSTSAWLSYLSNRTLREEVEATRYELKKKEIELVRLNASVEEEQKALGRFERELDERAARIKKQEDNRLKLLEVLRQSDEDLWVRHRPIIKAPDHDAKIGSRKLIVITVANNKGGVGKSTVTLNIAAHFDKHPLNPAKKRLLIDMDYQGTTSYVLTTALDILERESRSQMLMVKGGNELALFNARLGLNEVLPGSELVPSFYELARHEEALLMEWLLGEADDDLRFRLANILHLENVVNQYDLVLIDAPPRLTTGTMNALCASTHLVCLDGIHDRRQEGRRLSLPATRGFTNIG